ncbi:MAG: hypothetical protein V1722_01790 [Candidatus Micrarchaeota archaeon]
MTSTEEITELKEMLCALERGMDKVEKSQRPTVLKLSKQLEEIIRGVVAVQEKEKAMWNPAMSAQVRLAKKGMSLGKELSRFELGVVADFDNHNISEDRARQFISIAKLLKSNSTPAARGEFKYFEEIIALEKEIEIAKAELVKKEQVLKKEQLKIEKTLKEINVMERETCNFEKVRRYEELLEDLEKLKVLRATYLHALRSRPVVELLGEIEGEGNFLKEYYEDFKEKSEMAQLKQFFSDYPILGKCNASQICEFFEYNEKKLSHLCPETSRFKSIVLRNQDMFKTISSLEQTAFLAVDEENEKTLDFYTVNVAGAREVVERIKELRKEKDLDKKEYEKSKLIEKSKEELGKYSKTALEEELKTVNNLLELLHSEKPEETVEKNVEEKDKENNKENAEKNARENKGLFSRMGVFFKKLISNS